MIVMIEAVVGGGGRFVERVCVNNAAVHTIGPKAATTSSNSRGGCSALYPMSQLIFGYAGPLTKPKQTQADAEFTERRGAVAMMRSYPAFTQGWMLSETVYYSVVTVVTGRPLL